MSADRDASTSLAEACALVAGLVRARPEEADRTARTLAPDGPGPGRRYLDGTRPVAYQQRFRAIEELAVLLDGGEVAALVFAFELLATLDPEAAVPAVERALSAAPDAALGAALSRVLGACTSERSFRLVLAHGEVPSLRDALWTHGWPGGVQEARALLASVDFHAPTLDPHARVRALPALAYLLRHEGPRALPLAEALLASVHANVDVAHMLHRLVPEGPEVLLRDLQAAAPGQALRFSQTLAVKVLLERAPGAAIDALGGEAFLALPEGRPRLRALMHWLRLDTWAKPHEGGPRGWLAADPRAVRLLAGLKGDPERDLAALARDLLATLPKAKRPPAPRATKKAAPVQAAPDPALLAELAAMREALERLVQHLRATKYRFAAPKAALVPPTKADLAALARLEKAQPVPPALSAAWRTLGAVDLRGHDPRWPRPAHLGLPGAAEPVWQTDPLVLAPAAQAIGEALGDAGREPFELVLAPDALGAAGFSAGVRTVSLPSAEADPVLHGTGSTLLAHLRRALAWGGFPGFEAIEGRPEAWLEAARGAAQRRDA